MRSRRTPCSLAHRQPHRLPTTCAASRRSWSTPWPRSTRSSSRRRKRRVGRNSRRPSACAQSATPQRGTRTTCITSFKSSRRSWQLFAASWSLWQRARSRCPALVLCRSRLPPSAMETTCDSACTSSRQKHGRSLRSARPLPGSTDQGAPGATSIPPRIMRTTCAVACTTSRRSWPCCAASAASSSTWPLPGSRRPRRRGPSGTPPRRPRGSCATASPSCGPRSAACRPRSSCCRRGRRRWSQC
mmetsp:Transcript_49270/g.141679  ORF Transcript_49270/g.141679 Transcript_49270/m.141679 type:complete len:244 (-) Transcript_49270:1732-2463(-)